MHDAFSATAEHVVSKPERMHKIIVLSRWQNSTARDNIYFTYGDNIYFYLEFHTRNRGLREYAVLPACIKASQNQQIYIQLPTYAT